MDNQEVCHYKSSKWLIGFLVLISVYYLIGAISCILLLQSNNPFISTLSKAGLWFRTIASGAVFFGAAISGVRIVRRKPMFNAVTILFAMSITALFIYDCFLNGLEVANSIEAILPLTAAYLLPSQ